MVLLCMVFLDVLCIDGVAGVGKTSQIILLSNLLKRLNIPYKVFHLSEVEDTSLTKIELLNIFEFLNQNPDGMVLCDGSIASDIVDDIARNMHREDLYKKHKDNLQVYENLNLKFNFVNIVLTPKNFDICQNRLKKKASLYSEELKLLENKNHLMVTAKGLRDFDNNMLTYNIKFNNLDIDGTESMLDIHSMIMNIIKERYQLKKPSN